MKKSDSVTQIFISHISQKPQTMLICERCVMINMVFCVFCHRKQ